MLRRAVTHQFWDTELSCEGETRAFNRPLVRVSFVLIRNVAGDSPAPFRAFVVALRLLAMFLVARFLRRHLDDDLLPVALRTGLLRACRTRQRPDGRRLRAIEC